MGRNVRHGQPTVLANPKSLALAGDVTLTRATHTGLCIVDPGPGCPRVVRMIVEIPKNSSHRVEYDGAEHVFRLDRTLYSPLHYPAEYGFIPGTIAEDGDPLDIVCLIEYPTFTGCLIDVRPIGLLELGLAFASARHGDVGVR